MTSKIASPQGRYYIGLMSGTSADGIDLALVEFSKTHQQAKLVASYYQPYNNAVAEKISSLYQPGSNEIDRAFHLDVVLARLFAQAILALLAQEQLNAKDIIAIGNHGQTIRHRPEGNKPFTLQIGCCQTLACITGIPVVGQFRAKDMALGGQGAPLVPIFHQQLFSQEQSASFVVNIGGIANITYLPAKNSNQGVLGFDTGPGNALLDDWFIKHHKNRKHKFDKHGAWAATGQANQSLVKQLMLDNYITAKAPKSTGREYFNLLWLEQKITDFSQYSIQELSPADIQASLIAFTAHSISHAIGTLSKHGKVYLCGGGVHNVELISALKQTLNMTSPSYELSLMQEQGVDGDLLEAMAFAWLAYAFDHELVSNMPEVTGASGGCTLGCLFTP